MTLFDVTKQICDAVQARAEKGTSILEDWTIEGESFKHKSDVNMNNVYFMCLFI